MLLKATQHLNACHPTPSDNNNAQEYKAVFEQLLLEEVGALVLRGVEEGQVLEPHPALAEASRQAGRFTLVTLRVSEAVARAVAEGDVLLLSRDRAADEGARRHLHALALIDGREGTGLLRLKLLLTDESQAGSGPGTER